MSNDVADCPYCSDGLIAEGYIDCRCDRCGRVIKYSEELGFSARIDNNRYRKRIGLKELEECSKTDLKYCDDFELKEGDV